MTTLQQFISEKLIIKPSSENTYKNITVHINDLLTDDNARKKVNELIKMEMKEFGSKDVQLDIDDVFRHVRDSLLYLIIESGGCSKTEASKYLSKFDNNIFVKDILDESFSYIIYRDYPPQRRSGMPYKNVDDYYNLLGDDIYNISDEEHNIDINNVPISGPTNMSIMLLGIENNVYILNVGFVQLDMYSEILYILIK